MAREPPPVSDQPAFWLGAHGIGVARDGLLPHLFLFNLLDPYLARLREAGAAEPQPDTSEGQLERAQHELTCLQQDLGLVTSRMLDITLEGLGLDVETLSEAFLSEVATRPQGLDGEVEERLLPRLLAVLFKDGLANPLLLRIAALTEAAARAESKALTVEHPSPIALEWLARLHRLPGARAFELKCAAAPLPKHRIDLALRQFSQALAWSEAQPFRRGAEHPVERLHGAVAELFQTRPKLPGSKTRSVPLEQTVAAALRHKDLAGISRVTEITDLDVIGVPVFSVVRPAAKVDISVHSGKGTTRDAALVSGLMEAIEIHCAENVSSEHFELRRTSYAAASPVKEFLNPTCLDLSRFTRNYRPDVELDWIRGTDLIDGRSVWVPLEAISMSMGASERVLFSRLTTNGLASGNNFEEAVCHGLSECIERDAILCAYFGLQEARLTPAELCLARISERDLPLAVHSVLERIANAGMSVKLFDVTSDVRVPTCWALLFEEGPEASTKGHITEDLHLSAGFGAHPDPEVALLRAITETVQTHTTNVQGAREDLTYAARSGSRRVGETAVDNCFALPFEDLLPMFRRVSELVLWPNCPTRAFRDLPGAVNVDVREDIAYELACLQQAGVAHPICVDLSRPPFDLSVVRILVPGLQTWDLDRLGWRGLRYLLEPASLFAKLS